MKIIFLGQFPTSTTIRKSNGKIDSLYRDSSAVIEGLKFKPNVELVVITSPDVVSFPKGRLYFESFYDHIDQVYSVSNLNIPIIKQLWTCCSMLISVIKNAPRKEKFAIIIPYMVFRHVLTSRLVKKIFGKRVIICTIIPDIFFPTRPLLKAVNRFTEKMAVKNDCFVLYTDPMADYLCIEKNRCVTIEGFKIIPDIIPSSSSKFTVTYTGSLEDAYGLRRLVDAMVILKDFPIELHLYGIGSSVPYIKKMQTTIGNIVYHGLVPKEEAINAIYTTSCLINPRNGNDGEFVNYSFPSKDIEYLGTGIPSILCKLPGMPIEYYGNFIDAGDGSPENLALSILKVYRMSPEDRKNLGKKAKDFILNRMNISYQTDLIINLISKFSV